MKRRGVTVRARREFSAGSATLAINRKDDRRARGLEAGLREISEAATRANQDALEVIQKRAIEGFDEIRTLIKTKR